MDTITLNREIIMQYGIIRKNHKHGGKMKNYVEMRLGGGLALLLSLWNFLLLLRDCFGGC